MATITAVDGGHVESIADSNRIIREIVEARNAAGSQESVLADDDGELDADVRGAASMDGVTPLPGVFDENPKDLVGTGKLPLHLWPTTATAMGCIALLNGALKYGRSNWRVVGVRASIYVDACQRHLAVWFEGHECDEEGVPHLSAALACLAILVAADAAGKLKDDRQISGGHTEIIERLTPHVERLRALHADRSPRHYTIEDNA